MNFIFFFSFFPSFSFFLLFFLVSFFLSFFLIDESSTENRRNLFEPFINCIGNVPLKKGIINAVRGSKMREFKFFLKKMSCLASANLPSFIRSFNKYILTNQKADIALPKKVDLVKAMVYPLVMYGCESWTINKAEHRRTDAFELWCWRRLLRVPWTAKNPTSPS